MLRLWTVTWQCQWDGLNLCSSRLQDLSPVAKWKCGTLTSSRSYSILNPQSASLSNSKSSDKSPGIHSCKYRLLIIITVIAVVKDTRSSWQWVCLSSRMAEYDVSQGSMLRPDLIWFTSLIPGSFICGAAVNIARMLFVVLVVLSGCSDFLEHWLETLRCSLECLCSVVSKTCLQKGKILNFRP